MAAPMRAPPIVLRVLTSVESPPPPTEAGIPGDRAGSGGSERCTGHAQLLWRPGRPARG